MLDNLSERWREVEDIAVKQRLQQAVLPNGIMYNKTAGAYYTAVLPCIFKVFEGFDTPNSGLVAGAGIAPAPSGSFTPPVSRKNGLYHLPRGKFPL